MFAWQHLIRKNYFVWKKHYIISTILLILPFYFLLRTFSKLTQITQGTLPQLTVMPLLFNWHKKSNENQFEVYFLRSMLNNANLGIINNINDTSNIKNYHKHSFEEYITDWTTGICVQSYNCTWEEFANEKDYVTRFQNNETSITEWVSLELRNGNPHYKLFTLYTQMYPRLTQTSEWYDIPNNYRFTSAEFWQVYFAKYLIEITSEERQDQTMTKWISIYWYPMRVNLGIKFFYPQNFSIIKDFMYLSVSFVSVFILLVEALSKEKLKRINTLLEWQGITKTQYLFAWFITYLIVTMIPMTLFIICIKYLWIELVWNLIALLIGILVLNYLNIFALSIFYISFINMNNTSKWWVYVLYLLPIIWYSQFCDYDNAGNISLRKYILHFIPNVNFALCFELIVLLSNYETGLTVDRIFAIHNDTNLFTLLLQNIVILVVSVVGFLIVDNCSCKCQNQRSNRKFKVMSKDVFKSNESNVNNDNSKSKLKRWYEEVSDLNLIEQRVENKCLSLRNIVKTFGDYTAVNNISLDWFQGQIFVLLGHNGAGKTTLLNILSGNIPLDEGEIRLENHFLLKDKKFLYNNLGLCGQEDIYFPDLTVYEQIKLVSQLKGENTEIKTDAFELITCLGWKEYADSKATSLSSGNLRKLCAAFAWWGTSKLVILDEPTSGMDFKSKKLFWDYLKAAKHNRIIIITTHSMDEAEYWADTIGIMSKGEIICQGSSSFLKRNYPCGYNINFVFLSNSIFKLKNDLINKLRAIEPGMKIKILSKDWIKLNFPETSLLNNKASLIFKTIDHHKDNYKIKDYTVSTTSLEDVFHKVNAIDFAQNWFENEWEDIMKTAPEDNKGIGLLFLDEMNKTRQSESQQNIMLNLSQQDRNDFNELDFEMSVSEPNWSNDNYNDNNNDKDNDKSMNENMLNSNSKHNTQINKVVSTVDNQKYLNTLIELKNEKYKFTKNQIWNHFKKNLFTFYRNAFANFIRLFISLWLIICVIALNQNFSWTYLFPSLSVSNYFPKSWKIVYDIINNDQSNRTSKTINELIAVNESIFSPEKRYLEVDTYNPINYTNISYSTDFGMNKHFLLTEYNNIETIYTNYYALSSPEVVSVMLNSIIQKQLLETYNISTLWFDSYANTWKNNNFTNDLLTFNYLFFKLISISHLLFSLFVFRSPSMTRSPGWKLW